MELASNNNGEVEWIQSIREGDHQTFEKLFKKHYSNLTRYSWRYVNSKAIAEEITQEVFADLWENRKKWEIESSLRSYLYKMVKNKSLNYLKHQQVEDKYDKKWIEKKEYPSIEYESDRREQKIKKAIAEEIAKLPPRGKMTYELHRIDGLTYKEIAEVMDVSVKTVESQMTRALKKLRENLSHLLPLF